MPKTPNAVVVPYTECGGLLKKTERASWFSVLIWEFQFAARLTILDPLRDTGSIPVALIRRELIGLLLYAHQEGIRPKPALPAIELRLEALLVLSTEISTVLERLDTLDSLPTSTVVPVLLVFREFIRLDPLEEFLIRQRFL